MDLAETISELVDRNQQITLAALGGLDAIGDEEVSSPLFPYMAFALIDGWETLDTGQRDAAKALIGRAISEATSAVALSDTCQVVVPAAPHHGLSIEVKSSLRDRVGKRSDQRTGAIAAIALRWLAALAVITDAARGAVVDALTEIALTPAEPLPFAVAAAQVAGVVYDHWRDVAATDCLSRLTHTSGDSDAWFALGQARLVDALDAFDRDACLAGLRSTIECFDFAAANGEQRPDALIYANAVRFVVAWVADASTDMLADYYQNAHEALQDYMHFGYRLPEQPGWLRPRFEAETAWIELVGTMERIADHGAADMSWYNAATAIGALADVYRAANSFYPTRTSGVTTANALQDLVAPKLVAPFVERSERLGYVAKWLGEIQSPDAEAFAELVRERSGRVVPPKSRAERHPAVADLLGGELDNLPDSAVIDLIEQRLQDRQARDRLIHRPVVSQVIDATVTELCYCPDFAGPIKERLQPIIVSVVRFLAYCIDAQQGSEYSHTRYLFKPDAHEGELQQHLIGWLRAYGFMELVVEAQHIAAGRIDLMFIFEGFRFVVELKREQSNATREGLSTYLRQAGAYQATDIAIGMLIALDLSAGPLPDHMRDHVWVEILPASESGGTGRYIVVVRIPGNRTAPSRLSSH